MKAACKSFDKNDSSKNIFLLINELIENNKLLSKILKEEPDLILLTGDIIDCTSKKYMDIINFISKMSEKIPTYYIPGNHETRAVKYEEIIIKFRENKNKGGNA